MATAASLQQAANQADANMYPFWVANTIDTRLAAFATTCLALFPEQQLNSHPVSNWLTLCAWLASQMPAANIPLAQFETAVQYVYRACLMGQQLQTQSLITAAQSTAMLAAYNAQF